MLVIVWASRYYVETNYRADDRCPSSDLYGKHVEQQLHGWGSRVLARVVPPGFRV